MQDVSLFSISQVESFLAQTCELGKEMQCPECHQHVRVCLDEPEPNRPPSRVVKHDFGRVCKWSSQTTAYKPARIDPVQGADIERFIARQSNVNSVWGLSG